MGLNVTNYVLQVKGDKSIASGFDHATRTGDNTFSIYFIDGSKVDLTIPLPSDGQDGISVTGISDKGNGVFTLLFSDGSESEEIQTVKGQKGDKGDKLTFNDLTDEEKASLKGADGFNTTITENADNTDKIYKLDIETVDGTFTTPNLKGADGQGGTGGSGEENTIESISVNGTPISVDENKNVDITVPDAYDDTDIRAELANKSDTDHTHTTVNGHTVESDVPVDAKFTDTVYDDTQVKTQIQAVANGLMDSVGYSADYKTIDIIAKNGVKKSVNVAPIISHASITELSDVDTTNKATGKALVYNATTSKHEYADVSGTDEKVKMDSSTDAKYLGELLDNVTIANENGELKVKKLDGQEVTITEINYLKGLTMNVMDLVNMFSNGGVKIINTPVATYAELLTLDKSSFIEGISYLVYVLADENHDNAKTTYLVDKDSETPTYFGFADSQRDFTTNPIDLASEITGKLGIANMDSDAIKALFTVDDTYKTETVTNNAFSTHGAKDLYDELLLAIGNKANSSDLTAHKNDTDIHVSTEDRTNWDSAKTHADSAHAPSDAQANVLETVKVNGTALTPSNKAVNVTVPTTVAQLTDSSSYAKKTDLHSHENKSVLDGITEEKVTAWDKAQENIIESVKINNQEITPDENKAVNIDLSGYAEHDEIVGENLIPYPYSDGMNKTMNGIEYTVNPDGSVTAVGTATETSAFVLASYLSIDPNVTYILSGDLDDEITYKSSSILFNAETGSGTSYWNYGKDEPVIFTGISVMANFRIRISKDETVNQTFYPMLEVGSVAHKYQPYNLSRKALRTDIDDVTELASRIDNQFSTASGDYITVNDSVDGKLVELGVKGNSFQKTYGGKNLYNPTLKTHELDGITCTQNVDANGNPDGTYTINGTSTKDRWISFGYTTLNPGKYKFIATENNVEFSNLCVSSKQTSIAIPGNIFTIQSKSVCDIGLSTQNNTFNNVLIKPMITTDLSATYDDFEPYVGGIPSPNPLYPQTINSVGDDGSLVVKSRGKNLIPFPYYGENGRVSGGLTFNYGDDATIIVNGNISDSYAGFGIARNIKVDAINKKYMIIGLPTNGSTSTHKLRIRYNLADGTQSDFINCFSANGTILDKKDSTYEGATIDIDLMCYDNKDNFKVRPMLIEVNEDGTYSADYEPYKSSTTTIPLSEPLRAIGDIKDEITYQDGKWGVLRRIKRINANDLSWYAYSDYVFGNGFTSDILPKSGTKAYCNIAKANYPMTNDWAEFCFTFTDVTSTSDCHLNVRDTTTFPTITEWNTYIASNNVYFIYPLATPTFTPFADQTLQYLSTYDGVTNISNDDALSAEMTVKYPTTDASGVGSRNESRIAELTKDTDDKFDDVNDSLSVIGKCKNLLNPTLQTTTLNGVTCTNNGDGTYTLNGTAISNTNFDFATNISIKKGIKYKLIGTPKQYTSPYANVYYKNTDWSFSGADWSDGTKFNGDDLDDITIAVNIPNGTVLNNVLIKPMLTTNLNATYDDFVPYTGDGETLTHDVADLKNDLGGLTFSASGTTLTITDGTNTWTLGANS